MKTAETRADEWQALLDRAQEAASADEAREILLAGGYPETQAGEAAAVLYNYGELKALPPRAGGYTMDRDPATGERRKRSLTAEETAETQRAWFLHNAPDGTDLRFHRMKKTLVRARTAPADAEF